MEYIEGRPIESLSTTDYQSCTARLAQAVQLMWQIGCDHPGPVDHEEPRGPIWAPDGCAYEYFAEREDLERRFNRALHQQYTNLDLSDWGFVHGHLDLA